MQETSLAHMKLPAEAKLLTTEKSILELTDAYDMKTSTLARWIDFNYIAAASVIVTGFGHSVDLFIGSIIISSLGLLGLLVVYGLEGHKTVKDFSSYFTKRAEPITSKSWKVWGDDSGYYERHSYSSRNLSPNAKGYKVHQRAIKFPRLAMFSPRRMFRKKLMNEIIWYNPVSDIYTREMEYLGFAYYTSTTETYAGQRAVFRQALASI